MTLYEAWARARRLESNPARALIDRARAEAHPTAIGNAKLHAADLHAESAAVLIVLGDLHAAEQSYSEAITAIRQAYPEDNWRTAGLLFARGEALLSIGRANEAIDSVREGAAMRERLFGIRSKVVLSDQAILAVAYDMAGRLDEALASLRKARELAGHFSDSEPGKRNFIQKTDQQIDSLLRRGAKDPPREGE